MKRRMNWTMPLAAVVTAVWAWGAVWAGEVPSRKALGRASAFAWALCDGRGAVALYECTGRAEGAGARAEEFRRLDEAKRNAPEVLVGDAAINGVEAYEQFVHFGGAAAGSRWMFALREVEKDAVKSPVRLDVAFTAPDGTGGERYWMLRNGYGAGRRPGGGCLDWEEDAPGLFFAAGEAEWAELKGIAALMGSKDWRWTDTPPEGVVATPWGQEVWRCLGDAVDGLTPAKKKAAEWFGRVLAKEKGEWSLGAYRAFEDAKAEELFGWIEFFRETMENPPSFHVIPDWNAWRVLERIEELMPGAPWLLYASTAFIHQEGVLGGQFNPPPGTHWVVALEKCTEETRPCYEQYVLKGQTGKAEGGEYAVLGGPGGRDGKQDGPDGLACVRWVDEGWKELAMRSSALLDAEELEDLRKLAAAAREGAVAPTEELATRWGREVAKAREKGRALDGAKGRGAGQDGP